MPNTHKTYLSVTTLSTVLKMSIPDSLPTSTNNTLNLFLIKKTNMLPPSVNLPIEKLNSTELMLLTETNGSLTVLPCKLNTPMKLETAILF